MSSDKKTCDKGNMALSEHRYTPAKNIVIAHSHENQWIFVGG